MFLNHEKEGEKRLQEFTDDRIEGNISIWKPLKKTKLPIFNANVKSFKINIDGKTIRFKEEINFMSRLIVATRSRPQIDISKYFGDYEFSVVPKSLFHDDGKLVRTKDKYVILQELEHLHPEINFTTLVEESESVIIFDGMAVVNRIDIQKQKRIIKTCRDFADVFSNIILKETQGFSEVRVLFDRYDELSLKSKTREDRTFGRQIQYKIGDDTNIESITSEKFLSQFNTKRNLTKYLSCKIAPVLSVAAKRYVVAYRSHLVCNTWKKSLFPAPSYLNPEEHGWEYDTNNNSYEAFTTDTLCMCNDCKNCPNEELIISESWGT